MAKKTKKPITVDDLPSDEAETAKVKGGAGNANTAALKGNETKLAAPAPKVIAAMPASTLGQKLNA